MNSITIGQSDLPDAYADMLRQNPLLSRVEATAKSQGWSDLEIRTLQLVLACQSNASLIKRLEALQVDVFGPPNKIVLPTLKGQPS